MTLLRHDLILTYRLLADDVLFDFVDLQDMVCTRLKLAGVHSFIDSGQHFWINVVAVVDTYTKKTP